MGGRGEGGWGRTWWTLVTLSPRAAHCAPPSPPLAAPARAATRIAAEARQISCLLRAKQSAMLRLFFPLSPPPPTPSVLLGWQWHDAHGARVVVVARTCSEREAEEAVERGGGVGVVGTLALPDSRAPTIPRSLLS